MSYFSLTKAVHLWLADFQLIDGWIVDLTCGAGFDTLFLAKQFKNHRLLAIDIQENALFKAQARLENQLGKAIAEQIEWRAGCHSQVGLWLNELSREALNPFIESTASSCKDQVALAIYNLGYLPGSDKTQTTKADSTLASLRAIKEKMAIGSFISLMLYIGHPGGQEEADSVLSTLKEWSYEGWNLWQMGRLETFDPHASPAPIWLLVEKRRG